MSEPQGASNNERILAAARTDNEELLLDVFEQGNFDINCTDGLVGKYTFVHLRVIKLQINAFQNGHLALHNAVSHGSTDVLEHILSQEGCDVDPINNLEKATPLHLAVKIEHVELRKYIVESLLDAGADTSIKDRNGETVLDIIAPDDTVLRGLIRKAQAQSSVSKDDIASDDDDEGSAGSGSGSDRD